MRNLNLSEVEEVQEYKRLVPGAYICRITAVEDVESKEYLKLEYDIAEGEFKGYYSDLYDSKNFWGGNFIKSYKETALSFFKGFITAIENSNKGYKFDNDESKLVRKLIGLVLSEEEYQKNDGSIGIRFMVTPRSVDEIKKGGIEIPAIKRLKGSSSSYAKSNNTSNNDFFPIEDDDIPF